MAKKIELEIESLGTYSQNKPVSVEKNKKESHDDYEQRTWMYRMHWDDDDRVFIPPMAFKNCISEAAKYLSIKTSGKATFTKHFKAGVLIVDPSVLKNPQKEQPILKDSVRGDRVFVPSNGIAGGGSRVWKTFPCIDAWKTSLTVLILDDIITESVFLEHINQAGHLIGVGRFRPINNGYYGRFKVNNHSWYDSLTAS
ncbi:hypothetical protein [Pleurocapsa sp. FMAR1]|uniref:hypothetical protein n=1 Tax=Pleurocapsa sp. FMAR1 TaxID=3040204 RepID=UPI0029C67455|nr:hypothetical protein [Pleurocapsa sp. FMAR1]